MELAIHQYSIKVIKWAGVERNRVVCHKHYGEPLKETKLYYILKYRNKEIKLKKEWCFVDYEVRTEIEEVKN